MKVLLVLVVVSAVVLPLMQARSLKSDTRNLRNLLKSFLAKRDKGDNKRNEQRTTPPPEPLDNEGNEQPTTPPPEPLDNEGNEQPTTPPPEPSLTQEPTPLSGDEGFGDGLDEGLDEGTDNKQGAGQVFEKLQEIDGKVDDVINILLKDIGNGVGEEKGQGKGKEQVDNERRIKRLLMAALA